jgi:hypothetical protein
MVSFCHHQTNSQIIESGHNVGSIAFCHTSLIFTQCHIPTIVKTILNIPVRTNKFEQFLNSASTGENKAM